MRDSPAPLSAPVNPRRAMTLIEMTITVFLVGLLFFLLIGWMDAVRDRAKEDLAVRLLADLDNALARYRRDTGHFPIARGPDSAIPVVVDLLDHPRTREIIQSFPSCLWRGPDAQRRLIDPWGTPLRYLSTDSNDPSVAANGGRPIFVSAGPDRDFGDVELAASGDNLRSDDPGPDGFRLHEALREALVSDELERSESKASSAKSATQPQDKDDERGEEVDH